MRRALADLSGVRGRLLALVLAALVPTLGLTLYRSLEDRRDATARAQADALVSAESAARTQSQYIDEAHHLLLGLAQLPEVRDMRSEECPRLLAGIVREFGVYANLGVAAPNGEVVCSGVPLPAPVNVSDRAYFQRAVARHDFAVGDYQIGRITRRASLDVGFPLLERSRVQGVAFAALDLDWLNEVVLQSRLPSGSVVTVLDAEGTILVRQPDAEKWVGRTLPEAELAQYVRSTGGGVFSGRGIDGVSRFYGISPLPAEKGSREVFVTVGIPTDAALADATQKLRRDLLVLGLVGLAALGLALTAAHVFLVRPIEALAVAARCVGAGGPRKPIQVRRAPRELAELGHTFEAMSESLDRREDELRKVNEDLERRVAQRTSDLEAANVELRRQATINRTVLDATVDAIALTDLEGKLLVANDATRRVMELLGVQPGATPAEIIEQASRGTTDPERFAKELAANVTDPERETVYEYELAGGGRWFRRYSGPVRDDSGAVVARIYTTREVTAEVQADRLKSELVATVSHELRTPLASILGFTELLVERELDEETRFRYLGTIRAEAKRLTALINDFLDLQRIETGDFAPSFEAVRLEEVLREQVELFSAQSADHDLTLELSPEPLGVVGDRERLAQVVGNLLSNAIKYSPTGGRVEVRADAQGDAVRISVTDEGLGIPAEQHERLFTKFFRVDSSDTRRIGGTGLGLALAREIVHAHHGRIGFESREGEGSTFWFELPAARRGATGGGRILVVEDDPAAAALMSEYLAGDGYEVEVVASGEDALERILQDPPLLVALDIGLVGELDGWQVLTSLKARAETAHIPVIVCTAGNNRQQAATLGAADFLVKPFSRERVRSAIDRLLPAGVGSILVADDEENIRRLVREAFADNGVEFSEAADGEETVALVRADPPDLLILDLLMPKLDGFEVLEQIQDDEATRFLPVIVLTAKQLSDEERRFLRFRAFSVLEKSRWSPVELRRLVAEALARAEL